MHTIRVNASEGERWDKRLKDVNVNGETMTTRTRETMRWHGDKVAVEQRIRDKKDETV